MNINLLQKNLKEGLNIISRIPSKTSTLPILRNILLEVEDNFLNISATDLELGIKWWGLTKINKKGSVVIPYNSFSSFINLLPDKKVELIRDDYNLLIECDDYKTQLNGFNPKDFPIIPNISKGKKVTIISNSLCDSLSQLIDIPSLSRVKPEISGILFSLNDGELKLVATDSYRLAEKKVNIKKDELKKETISFIIPQKTAREVINIFKESNKEIDIIFGENQILFKLLMDDFNHSYIELTSKIIEGDYPNYESIIPKKYKTQIILNKDEFLNKIKAASVFTSKINEVELSISPEKENVLIKSGSSDLGSYESNIKGRSEGEELNISFNYKFLLDGLNNIKSSEIIFEAIEESSPGLLKPVGRSDFLYVVMPIRK